MERRNFLGLAGLMGLLPLVPKIVIGENTPVIDPSKDVVKATPIEGVGTVFNPEEFKNNLVEEFEISVTEYQIPVGHKNQFGRWYQITGKGILDGEIVTFKTDKIKEQTNAFDNPPIVWINETQKAKLISVRSSCEPLYDGPDDYGFPTYRRGRQETILICQKI